MAALLVGQVLERWPGHESLQMLIAVILADAADPDGSNVYPSVGRIAKLARCSIRSVQYSLRDFVLMGFLVLEHPGGGRGRPARYRIVRHWLESQQSALASAEEISARAALISETVQHDTERVNKSCTKHENTPQQPLHTTQQRLPVTRKEAAATQSYEITSEGIVFSPGNVLDELGLEEIRRIEAQHPGTIFTAIKILADSGKRPFTSGVLVHAQKCAKQCAENTAVQRRKETEARQHLQDVVGNPQAKSAGDSILSKIAAKRASKRQGEGRDE